MSRRMPRRAGRMAHRRACYRRRQAAAPAAARTRRRFVSPSSSPSGSGVQPRWAGHKGSCAAACSPYRPRRPLPRPPSPDLFRSATSTTSGHNMMDSMNCWRSTSGWPPSWTRLASSWR